MNIRYYRLFLLIVFSLALLMPAVYAQIVMDVSVTLPPPGSTGTVRAFCNATMDPATDFGPYNEEWFYQGVYLESCVLYTPGNGESSCGGGGYGGGYAGSNCTITVETSSSGNYYLDAQSAVYNWYDAYAQGTGYYGWDYCFGSDYPYDDPLGYGYLGTNYFTNTTQAGPYTGYGIVFACNPNNAFGDIMEIESPPYAYTAPVNVTISPSDPPNLNQGQSVTFLANIPQVNWTLSGPGSLTSSSGQTTSYQAPASVTTEEYPIIKATSQQESTNYAEVSLALIPVTLSVTPTSGTLIATAGATLQLSANAAGTQGTPAISWSLTGNGAVGGINPPTGTSSTYTAPTPAITAPATFNISVTDALATNSPIQVPVTLVPPVIISSITSPWPAGQSTAFTITGSGFGSTPTVSLNPNVGTLSFNANAAGTQITGTITILSNVPTQAVIVTVTNPSTAVGALSATGNAAVAGATLSLAVTPTGVQLDETQSQQFTPTITCKTSTGATCSAGSPAINWSINPGVGSISSSGLYTANVKGITQNTPVTVTACAAIVAQAASTCGTDQITILPITIGNLNSPPSPILAGKQYQFNPPSITNAPNNNQTVYWYINGNQGGNNTLGTISTGGLYTAPSTVTATSIQVSACSTVDTSRCTPTPATVQLADFTVTATPTSRTVTVSTPVTYTMTVGTVGQFTGTVVLTNIGCPTGATCLFNPASISSFPGTSTLTVTTTATTPTGTDSIAITGTNSGSSGPLARSASISLTVDSPTFTVTVTNNNPSQTALSLGHSMSYSVNVSSFYGFTGTVMLTVNGLPAGVTASFSPAFITTSGSATLTLTSAYSTSTYIGNSNVTITGTSGSLAIPDSFPITTQPLQYKGTCGVQ